MEGTARERFQFNYRVNTKNARIGFATEGSGAWKVWDRFLTVDGNKVFHIGNICDTCNFFFEKLEDSTPLCASEISECLNNNKDLFSKEFLNSVAALLPADDYVVAHVDLLPRLVEFGKEGDYFSEDCKHFFALDQFEINDPKTAFYRCPDVQFDGKNLLFNFAIPFQSPGALDMSRVAAYLADLDQGLCPTALAISVLDIKSSSYGEEDEPITSHWNLAHYLLDGHHKIHAAALSERVCSLLCFISREQSFGGDKELKQLMQTLAISEKF